MQESPVVVITGASAGLGRAIAHAFAKRGAKIGLMARNPEALNAAQSECEALGGSAIVLPVDVSDAEAVDKAASRVEQEFGPIDIWVNDAMVSVFSPVKEMEPSDYKRVTDVLYSARSRNDNSDWVRAFVSLDSFAIGILRLQTCHQWLH
jgi:NAD(P)-dependent dehydrogenase (short-subunit alcohol dehydrogenase family)